MRSSYLNPYMQVISSIEQKWVKLGHRPKVVIYSDKKMVKTRQHQRPYLIIFAVKVVYRSSI